MSDWSDNAQRAGHEIERLTVAVNRVRLQRDYETHRVADVADEYQKAGKSWDATRARLTAERDEARATIERVTQVVTGWRVSDRVCVSDIRAALKSANER